MVVSEAGEQLNSPENQPTTSADVDCHEFKVTQSAGFPPTPSKRVPHEHSQGAGRLSCSCRVGFYSKFQGRKAKEAICKEGLILMDHGSRAGRE